MSDLFRLKVQQIYSILSKISDCNEKERSKSLDVIKSLIEQLTSIDMQQVLYQTYIGQMLRVLDFGFTV